MGVWMTFVVVITLISLLLTAEPQEPKNEAGRTDNKQNCYVNVEPSGLIKIGPNSGSNQTKGEQGECVFRTDVIKDYWDKALIIFTIIFSGGLVWIGFRQIVWMKRTKEVSESAAKAADKSADAAEESLRVYRPFLIVKKPDVRWPVGPPSGETPETVSVTVSNYGLGPADITGFHFEAQLFECDNVDPAVTYDESQAHITNDPIVASEGSLSLPPKWLQITKEDFALMKLGKKHLGIHGIIYYRGGPLKPYWTRFFWWYMADSRPEHTARANNPELNAHS
jgi:hypothetical protein